MPESTVPVKISVDPRATADRLERVLVIGCRLFGDALLSVHAVKSLWKALPRARFDLLTPTYTRGAYEWIGPWSRHLTPDTEAARPGSLRKAKYDLALILPGGMGWAILPWRAAIPCRIGHASDHRAWFLTGHVGLLNDRPNFENFNRILAALPFSVPVQAACPPVAVSPIPPPFLVFAPGASESAKMWPANHWASLARRFRAKRDLPIVWLGSAKEAGLISNLAAPEDTVAAGRFDFGDLCSLLAASTAFLGNNSGLSHLAGLCGARTLVLTGPSNPFLTRPFGDRSELLWVDDPKIPPLRRGDRRYRHALPMAALTVESVYERLSAGLTASAGTGTPGPGN